MSFMSQNTHISLLLRSRFPEILKNLVGLSSLNFFEQQFAKLLSQARRSTLVFNLGRTGYYLPILCLLPQAHASALDGGLDLNGKTLGK